MKSKTDETYLLAETLFANAWGHNPKQDAQALVTMSLEAAISFDEKIELLKANGLATAMAKETEQRTPEPPAKAKTAKAAPKAKRSRR